MGIQHAIKKVSQQEHLSREEAQAAMYDIMTGQATPAQIGGYLMGLRVKGETVEEITGSAHTMREVAHRISVPAPNLLDTCGTGGDASHTFNISTTVAFVAAAAGIPVAKHGNRAVSSKSGSADVLKALGVHIDLAPEQAARCIGEVGIAFLFAPNFHPAMKHAMGPRREMGVRTIFNILGPLTNPAGARRQVMGVFSANLTETLAKVLKELESEAALVVHGAGGLDELSTLGVNRVSELRDGKVISYDLDPAELGLKRSTLADLQGGTPEDNAHITREILAGRGTDAQRDMVLLNAAAALVIGGLYATLAEGLDAAAQILESGKGMALLEKLIAYTHQHVPEEL